MFSLDTVFYYTMHANLFHEFNWAASVGHIMWMGVTYSAPLEWISLPYRPCPPPISSGLLSLPLLTRRSKFPPQTWTWHCYCVLFHDVMGMQHCLLVVVHLEIADVQPQFQQPWFLNHKFTFQHLLTSYRDVALVKVPNADKASKWHPGSWYRPPVFFSYTTCSAKCPSLPAKNKCSAKSWTAIFWSIHPQTSSVIIIWLTEYHACANAKPGYSIWNM